MLWAGDGGDRKLNPLIPTPIDVLAYVLIGIAISLAGWALWKLLKSENTSSYRLAWGLAILFVPWLGAIAFLLLCRIQKEGELPKQQAS